MKKIKQEKGITLVALIITIVVLLILAVVAIGVVKNSDIITYAKNASNMYGTEKNEENQMLQNYIGIIENSTNTTDNIAILLVQFFKGEIDEELLIEQMKQELSIEGEIDNFHEFFTEVEVDGSLAVYIYNADRLYALELDENGEPNGKAIYLKEEKNKDQYRLGRTMKKIIAEIEEIFIGKTVSEMSKKYEDGILDELIIDNSEYIIDINTYFRGSSFGIKNLTWKEGDYEVSISTDDDDFPKTFWIEEKDGVYYKVFMENGG